MEINVVNMYKDVPRPHWYKNWREGQTLWLYCGRPSIYGNPYNMGPHESKVRDHQVYWSELGDDAKPKEGLRNVVRDESIEVLNLVCFCKPKACHCDTMHEWLVEEMKKESV